MSRRSIALQAYLTFASGSDSSAVQPVPERPDDRPMILLVAIGQDNRAAFCGLVARLQQQRPDIALRVAGDLPGGGTRRHIDLPPDRRADCASFARLLRPVMVIWAGNKLRPALLDALAECGAHLVLINADKSGFSTTVPRWLPDPTPAVLALFDTIHATNAEAARHLRRIGVRPDHMQISGPLSHTTMPLDCNETQREEMAASLAGRPVWLAAHIHPDEAVSVLRAHRKAGRLAHRLLLIAVPDDATGYSALLSAAADLQLRVCHWDDGEMPDANTQVILTETPDELGLWYRLAPLTFIGNSLVAGAGGKTPFEAASLGAAILYGPNVGQWLGAYSRLVEAGAARIVRDADSLAAGVSHLISPDQSAAMAHAGWDVVSESAELADRLIADCGAQADGAKQESA